MSTIKYRMLNVLNLGQSFCWNLPGVKFCNTFENTQGPKLVLINSVDDWYNCKRDYADMYLYWSSECLANERAIGTPILPISNKDRVFSSSTGPNNYHNLHFWFWQTSNLYKSTHFKRLLPRNKISVNKLLCTLGQGRLPRIFAYKKICDLGLLNHNVSFATNEFFPSMLPDASNELPGQHNMLQQIQDFTEFSYRPLELEWRATKTINWYSMRKGINASAIIPTHAYHDSSLILVLESVHYNTEFFVTEKTVKALLSGRPFILVGCINMLRYLHELGFKTWNTVLDETYDQQERLDLRIDQAMASAKEYINSNVLNRPDKLEIIRNISDHNRRVLFETDWLANIKLAQQSVLRDLSITHIHA